MSLFDLTGRTALVTGSTRGLGLALARALADAGARVAINGRSAEACEARAAEIDGAVAAPFDVTDEEAVAAGVARLGRVDVLVSNAGMTLRRPLEQFTLAEWRELLDVNLTSAFLVARAVAPGMIERRAGEDRHGLLGDERPRARDGRRLRGDEGRAEDADPLDVRRLGALQHPGERDRPGYFRTELTEPLTSNAEFDEWLRERVPAGRWGEPSELAGAVVFLASAASDFVNGQILYVDGGMSAVV